MPCFAPLTAYRSKEVGKSGKRGITFDRNSAFSGVKLMLPCGQCSGCRLEKSRQWAMRCMHEKQMHDSACFLTLTYDNDWLPACSTLVKRDLQLFMKRLRKRVDNDFGVKVRFYACGEYGARSLRPHYHILLFGFDPPDKKFYKLAKRGEKLYTSKYIESCWTYGYNVIGDVTFDSCAYVARYIMDKMTGPLADSHYVKISPDGEVIERIPEFTVMSRRPGIGSSWFAKFGEHSYKFDSVVMNGKEVRPPRFYDTRYDIVDSERLAALKVTRRKAAMRHRSNNTPDRRRVRELVQLKKLRLFKRDLG